MTLIELVDPLPGRQPVTTTASEPGCTWPLWMAHLKQY